MTAQPGSVHSYATSGDMSITVMAPRTATAPPLPGVLRAEPSPWAAPGAGRRATQWPRSSPRSALRAPRQRWGANTWGTHPGMASRMVDMMTVILWLVIVKDGKWSWWWWFWWWLMTINYGHYIVDNVLWCLIIFNDGSYACVATGYQMDHKINRWTRTHFRSEWFWAIPAILAIAAILAIPVSLMTV